MNRIYTALVLYIAVNISGWDLYRVTDDGFYSADPSISVLGDTVAIAYESYAYGNDEIVMKYSLNRGASFSSPIRISTNDSCSWRPKISISNGFDIVWEDNRTGKRQIFYSRILNGTPSVNLRISSGIGASAFPSMASDGQNLFIMWEDNRDGNDEIYFRKFDGGTWSPEKRVTSTDSTSWGATVAYDKSTGLLHAAYFDYSTGNDEIYYISSTDRGATWSTPVNISNDTPDSWEPRIAALNGRVAIVWYSYNTSSQSYEVLFSEKSGTTFSLPVFVSSTGNDSKCPTITMNSSSTSVAWEDFRDGNDEIYTATRTNGQLVWIEERVTNDPADSFGAAAFATSDNLFVAWYDYRDTVDQIYCARKNPVHSEFTFQKDILKNPINISPNPATNLVQIRTNGISGNIQITFTGIDGKTALKMNTKTIKTINTFKTNVNSLPTGAYIIRASDGRSIYTKLITLIK